MPAKNSIKQYLENGYYHIYNRGVEKRPIFQDRQDYNVLLSYLNDYLSPADNSSIDLSLADPKTTGIEKDKLLKRKRRKNYFGRINLMVYGLMPNHFHFLVKQNNKYSIDKFMNSLGIRYTKYFNTKNKRVGSLYQDVYKAVLIQSDEQLLEVTRYIHKQTIIVDQSGNPFVKQPSSVLEYVGKRKTPWVISNEVLSFFSKTNPLLSYKAFLLQTENRELIAGLTIDDE